MRNTSLAAIVVGGGSSSRMQGHDKLYAPLGGRSVLAATVEVFESSAAVNTIILVVAEERVGFCRELARKRSWRKVRAICAGGTSRSHSVANGLQALDDTPAAYVAVHDAARPFVTPELIARFLLPRSSTARRCLGYRAPTPSSELIRTILHARPYRAAPCAPYRLPKSLRALCWNARTRSTMRTSPRSPMTRPWWRLPARLSTSCRGTMVI